MTAQGLSTHQINLNPQMMVLMYWWGQGMVMAGRFLMCLRIAEGKKKTCLSKSVVQNLIKHIVQFKHCSASSGGLPSSCITTSMI